MYNGKQRHVKLFFKNLEMTDELGMQSSASREIDFNNIQIEVQDRCIKFLTRLPAYETDKMALYRSSLSDKHKLQWDNSVFFNKSSNKRKKSVSYDEIRKQILDANALRNRYENRTTAKHPKLDSTVAWYFGYLSLYGLNQDIRDGSFFDIYPELKERIGNDKNEIRESKSKDIEGSRNDYCETFNYTGSDEITTESYESKMAIFQMQISTYADPLISKLVVQIENHTLLEGDQGLKKRFEQIVNSECLTTDNVIEINRYLKPPFKWFHKAMIASALTLSLFNGVDIRKVDLLKRIIEVQKEPTTYKRGVIGLVIALVLSHRTPLYRKLLKELDNLAEAYPDFSEGICRIVECMLLVENATSINRDEDNLSDILGLSLFQLFEPFHMNLSYYSQILSPAIGENDRAYMFDLLNRVPFEYNVRHIALSSFTSGNETTKKLIIENLEKALNYSTNCTKCREERIKTSFEVEFNLLFQGMLSIKKWKTQSPFDYHQMAEMHVDIFEKFPNYLSAKFLPINFILERISIDAIVLEKLRSLLYKEKRYEDVLLVYDEVLKIDEENEGVLIDKGAVLDRLGKYKEALVFHDKVIHLNGKNAYAWYNRGITLRKLKRFLDALSAFKEAVMIKPNYEDAWLFLGHTNRNLNEQNESIKAFEEVILLNENNATAWLNIGTYSIENNNYEKALYALDKVIEIGAEIELAWYNKGVALQRMNRCKEAVFALEKAIEVNPQNVYALEYLGCQSLTSKDYKEAKKLFLRLLRVKETGSAYANLGHCDLILNSKVKAIYYYKKSLDLFRCSEEFFEVMDEDFQYLEGVTKNEYLEIKKSLRDYCERK